MVGMFSKKLVNLILLTTYLTLETQAFQLPAPIVDTCIGAIAGGIGAFCVYPIDFVKTQLQTESGRKKYNQGGLETFQQIIKDEGSFFNLYRGVWVQILGVAPEKAIKLSVNDMARHVLLSTSMTSTMIPLPPIMKEMIAGGIAGASQVVVTNPLEVTKVALQTSDMPFQDIWNEIGGFKGLYRGADACLMRDVSFSLILFPLYSHAKEWIPGIVGDSLPFPLILALSGMIAAAPAAYLTTPFDIVKTRQQSLSESGAQVEQKISFSKKRNVELINDTQESHKDHISVKFRQPAFIFDSNYRKRSLEHGIGQELSKSTPATIVKPISSFTFSKKHMSHSNYHHFSSRSSSAHAAHSTLVHVPTNPSHATSFPPSFSSPKSSSSRDMNAFEVAYKLFTEDHPSVFFSGGMERIARSAPQFGVTLAIFDLLKNMALDYGILPALS